MLDDEAAEAVWVDDGSSAEYDPAVGDRCLGCKLMDNFSVDGGIQMGVEGYSLYIPVGPEGPAGYVPVDEHDSVRCISRDND